MELESRLICHVDGRAVRVDGNIAGVVEGLVEPRRLAPIRSLVVLDACVVRVVLQTLVHKVTTSLFFNHSKRIDLRRLRNIGFLLD